METNVKKREWVKTAAIIFLAVLLVLTFFSNTIMNYSLPEVATQMVSSGSINAKIRGQGSVSANETYDVTITQTRRIASVLVRQGQEVAAGEALFLLEAEESEELKAAQEQLESMELAYQKSLIEAGNASSTEDRQIQKARDDYNEALDVYYQYSTMDASYIKQAKAQAEQKLKAMQRELDELTRGKAEIEEQKADASTSLADLEAAVIEAEKIKGAFDAFKSDRYIHGSLYDDLLVFSQVLIDDKANTNVYGQNRLQMAAALANDQHRFEMDVSRYFNGGAFDPQDSFYSLSDQEKSTIERLYNAGYINASSAYTALTADYDTLVALMDEFSVWSDKDGNGKHDAYEVSSNENSNKKLNEMLSIAPALGYSYEDDIYNTYQRATDDLDAEEAKIEVYDTTIDQYDNSIADLNYAIEDQQDVVSDLASAESAAEMVKSAKENLEDLLFQQSLGDSSYLDVQAAKEAIEEQKQEVERLTANADESEVTAKVSGVIGAIHVTAGNTIGAETPLCTIEVVDRGYTIKIPVTNEQAKKVKVGDTADLVNYWGGDIDAVLENIVSDPANPGQGRLLVFRLTGEVEPGVNLTLSIGQKSANYDCLVPNSAVRNDSNGSFVLVLVAKSSPLGNRFTAVRADVQVLATDDTMTAVTGLSNGDFVITTSTQPIEAGQQVRQVEQ